MSVGVATGRYSVGYSLPGLTARSPDLPDRPVCSDSGLVTQFHGHIRVALAQRLQGAQAVAAALPLGQEASRLDVAMSSIRSVEIFTPCRDQHACVLTCEAMLSVSRRLSLLSGRVRPKSGQPEGR